MPTDTPIKKLIENPYTGESWARLDWDTQTPPVRALMERETNRDLAKSLEQLLCDVHEEIHHNDGRRLDEPRRSAEENFAHAQKRMVALMARTAIDNNRFSEQIHGLTVKNMRVTYAAIALAVVALIPTFFQGCEAYHALQDRAHAKTAALEPIPLVKR
jgi:hypothetical protein